MALNFNPNHFADDLNVLTNTFIPLTPGEQFVYEGVANSGGGVTNHQSSFHRYRYCQGHQRCKMFSRVGPGYKRRCASGSRTCFLCSGHTRKPWSSSEYPEIYENDVFTGAPDTWMHGTSDAQGGVHMLANPREGKQPYVQGIVPSIEFHDVAQVTDTGGTLKIGPTTYTDVLSSEEWNPDEPDVRQGKFYAPDVGIVQITAINDPEAETLNLTEVKHLDADEMAIARKGARIRRPRLRRKPDIRRSRPCRKVRGNARRRHH